MSVTALAMRRLFTGFAGILPSGYNYNLCHQIELESQYISNQLQVSSVFAEVTVIGREVAAKQAH